MIDASLKLDHFQEVGAQFLARKKRAMLADEMRVGKTPQAVVACDHVGARKITVLCPAIARQNWRNELERWTGREGNVICSADDKLHPFLNVCSYDLLHNDAVWPRIARANDVVILDESHYLKNAATNRTRAAFALANGAKYAWALSGTPAPNNVGDLHPVLSSFGVIDFDYSTFIERFCSFRQTKYGVKISGTKNSDELSAILKPFYLRRRLAEVAPDMPAIRYSPLVVEAGDVDARLLYGFHDRPAELISVARKQELELIQALDLAGDQIEMLKQTQSEIFRRLVGLQKVEPTVELIEQDMAAGVQKIVVFAWHRDVLRALQSRLAKYGARVIDGSTSDGARTHIVRKFQTNAPCRVVLCQIAAAATNIDLSVADDGLFVETDWVDGNNKQAAHRLVSRFKTRPVRLRILSIAGSVDERIQRAALRKCKEVEKVFK